MAINALGKGLVRARQALFISGVNQLFGRNTFWVIGISAKRGVKTFVHFSILHCENKFFPFLSLIFGQIYMVLKTKKL
jgi:hypothetical protein